MVSLPNEIQSRIDSLTAIFETRGLLDGQSDRSSSGKREGNDDQNDDQVESCPAITEVSLFPIALTSVPAQENSEIPTITSYGTGSLAYQIVVTEAQRDLY